MRAPVASDAFPIYAVDTANNLLRFDSTTPGTIETTKPVTGLQAGENIHAIDFRPQTAQLYALGSSNRLYILNTTTGAATAVGAPGGFTLVGSFFGFDFNAADDRIRVVSSSEQNFRLNPISGVGSPGSALAYAAGDPNAGTNPTITGAAYDNSVLGATTATMYDIDSTLNILVRQDTPGNGTLHTIGSSGCGDGQQRRVRHRHHSRTRSTALSRHCGSAASPVFTRSISTPARRPSSGRSEGTR